MQQDKTHDLNKNYIYHSYIIMYVKMYFYYIISFISNLYKHRLIYDHTTDYAKNITFSKGG